MSLSLTFHQETILSDKYEENSNLFEKIMSLLITPNNDDIDYKIEGRYIFGKD